MNIFERAYYTHDWQTINHRQTPPSNFRAQLFQKQASRMINSFWEASRIDIERRGSNTGSVIGKYHIERVG